MTEPKFDDVKTPLYAAVGVGDAVVQAVADVVAQVRSRAETAAGEVSEAVDSARTRLADIQGEVTENVESLVTRLERLPAELPEELESLRERFSAEELKKVAEAYLKVASDIYTSLAERGEEAVERILNSQPVQEGLGALNETANEAVDFTQSTLGKVASQTRAVGERAAELAGIASDQIKEGADDIATEVSTTGKKIQADAKTASQEISGLIGTVEAKVRSSKASPVTRTPAKKAAPAKKATATKATPVKKAPAKKAPAKKS